MLDPSKLVVTRRELTYGALKFGGRNPFKDEEEPFPDALTGIIKVQNPALFCKQFLDSESELPQQELEDKRHKGLHIRAIISSGSGYIMTVTFPRALCMSILAVESKDADPYSSLISFRVPRPIFIAEHSFDDDVSKHLCKP